MTGWRNSAATPRDRSGCKQTFELVGGQIVQLGKHGFPAFLSGNLGERRGDLLLTLTRRELLQRVPQRFLQFLLLCLDLVLEEYFQRAFIGHGNAYSD